MNTSVCVLPKYVNVGIMEPRPLAERGDRQVGYVLWGSLCEAADE